MPNIPQRIASAFAVLCGRYGDVTTMADQRDRSRQSLYREAAKVVEAVDGAAAEARIDDLRRQIADRDAENRALRGSLEHAVEMTRDVQDEFASVAEAQAEGVSLPVARGLLLIVAGSVPVPGVATLGGTPTGPVARPGPCSRSSTRRPGPASRRPPPMRFFGPSPALMVVEPESLCWMAGRMAGSRDWATWAREFARLPALKAVVRDEGTGLGRGAKLDNPRRRQAGLAEFGQTLDVFHTLRALGRASRRTWGVAIRALGRAEVAQEGLDRLGRRGRSRQGHGGEASRLWRQAERTWDRATVAEAAWGRARSALEAFTPEGRPNDRARAEAVVAALPELAGEAWARTRRWLMRREGFTFLDQGGERLAGLGLAPEVLSALLDLEGLRRRPGRPSAATRAWSLARAVQLSKSCPDWPDEAGRVRAVLRGAWRASSLEECVNSVARMQQARHRKMTRGLLDPGL